MESKSKKFRDAKNRRFGVVNAVKGYWDFGILGIQIFKRVFRKLNLGGFCYDKKG